MKRKLFAAAVLSVCSLAMFAAESQAFFGLFHHFHHNRYVTHITCRPYNAFTPICWGNLVCDGCCPNMGGGHMPMTMGAPPWACGVGPCFGGACGPYGGAMASDMPLMMPPNGNAPAFTPPMPMPLPNGPNTTMYPPMGVSQANYYPMYPQPYYMPMQYNPYMMPYAPAPSYWYGR